MARPAGTGAETNEPTTAAPGRGGGGAPPGLARRKPKARRPAEVLTDVEVRARTIGRWLSLGSLIGMHREARDAIAEVGKRFADNPGVTFSVYDGMTGKTLELSGEALASGAVRRYSASDADILRSQVARALEAARADPELSPGVLARLEGRRPELEGSGGRGG